MRLPVALSVQVQLPFEFDSGEIFKVLEDSVDRLQHKRHGRFTWELSDKSELVEEVVQELGQCEDAVVGLRTRSSLRNAVPPHPWMRLCVQAIFYSPLRSTQSAGGMPNGTRCNAGK